MRKPLAAMALVVAVLALCGEGCAPVPLPHYAAWGPRRVEELLVDSENMRLIGDDWERTHGALSIVDLLLRQLGVPPR